MKPNSHLSRPKLAILMLFFLALGATALAQESAVSDVGLIALRLNDHGFLGSGFQENPSCRYPSFGPAEHLYFGGLWVGARRPDGQFRVSTAAEDASGLNALNEIREFQRDEGAGAEAFRRTSSNPNSVYYSPRARAPFHLFSRFHDYPLPAPFGHQPLGLRVRLEALAWAAFPGDDFVILQYTIINDSGSELSDVYLGHYNDTVVADVEAGGWVIFYDDLNGAWRPGDLGEDPEIWMMHEHDADGDDGQATSWVGCRLLGTWPQPQPASGSPPVSYNAWRYNQVPAEDDWYFDPGNGGQLLPGKYQLMSNENFDVGLTPEDDFSVASNWLALLSTGPFPALAAGDSLKVSFALVCAPDEAALLENSRRAQFLHDNDLDPQALSAAPERPVPADNLQAYPNPFNPVTTLHVRQADDGPVRLVIHDLQGRHLRTLWNGSRPAGVYTHLWDGRDDAGRTLPSGVYFARMTRAGETRSLKLVLVQ